MSLLLNCQNLSKAYGSQLLFENLSLSIFKGDRIGLIGPNGAGKSTLLKILAGIESPNEGLVAPRGDLKIGYVPQLSEFADESPLNIILSALKETSDLDEHEKLNRAQTWLSKLRFTGDEKSAHHLSGGWKKRLSIAVEMAKGPDLILYDEPTNHLDLEGIIWLENFMQKEAGTYILVSHDRTFLQNLTNRVVEINPLYPTGLFSVEGNYDQFIEKKERFIEGQLQQERSIASKVRREGEWLSSSPKARTTKARSRINEAAELFEEHSSLKVRNRQKTATIHFDSSDRQTNKLLVAKNIKMEIASRPLFDKLDLTFTPGMRLGLMGPNGSGKTTLMRLLAGELSPEQGTIKRADDLKIVYFDQHRSQLPLSTTMKDALSPSGDFVHYRGQAIHVNGWCKRFLFPPEYLGMPLSKLSGGERARIAIARLMLQPADILLLDEPTNDLDIPTLQALEDNLLEFPGAIVLITHDRSMLDNICNTFLPLGDPSNNELYAEYSQWERAHLKQLTPAKPAAPPKKKSLSREARKERSRIEKAIEKKEGELALLEAQMEGDDHEKLAQICAAAGKIREDIDELFDRWAKLEEEIN